MGDTIATMLETDLGMALHSFRHVRENHKPGDNLFDGVGYWLNCLENDLARIQETLTIVRREVK